MWQTLRPSEERQTAAPLAALYRRAALRLAVAFALAQAACAADAIPEPRAASFDELMFHASRYGNTPERRANKAAAREEFKRRGLPSLAYFIERMQQDNMSYFIFARELVDSLPDESSAGVLVAHCTNPTNDIRRTAVYLLGFCDTPGYARRIRPLLTDTNVAGAAARTLGKWKDRESVRPIAALLSDPRENRRTLAAVALGDIGAPEAVPWLISALGDPMFTVRNAAAESLAKMPARDTGKRLLDGLPGATGPAVRQIVRLLGALRYEEAKPALEVLLDDADPGWRGDAVYALRQLGEDMDAWASRKPDLAAHPFVQARLHEPVPEP